VDYLPLFMNVQGSPCLVVGGGEVAARKAALLARAGAELHVVAPELSPGMREVLEAASGKHSARGYEPSDVASVQLVIAATGDRELNARISQDARAQRVPINVVDDPELCSFIMPAIVDRSPLLVAISTGGASPVLARLTRGRIETAVSAEFGALARLCMELRAEVSAQLPDVQRKRRFWETVLDGPVAELALSGRLDAARQGLLEALQATVAGEPIEHGEVFLVGIGPNDPELVSFRAVRLMQRAELVLSAVRVSESILDLCRRDAAREKFVDVAPDVMPLVAMRAVRAARGGQRVCVLGVGDPFRSGAGADLRARLVSAGLICHVVPGVS
jgi:uroporphyrin-III C-methyltransferase/precorrin-2 dehydrogenase/sirohydrochlorin ferrochelatase